MALSLRSRIYLTLVPLLALLAAMGSVGAVLLYRLGNNIDAILRENYRSVIYMERLNESLERIDSSFQFALAGREETARQQYEANWPLLRENLRLEQENITIEGERELVSQLTTLTEHYRARGEAFYERGPRASAREQDYFGPAGLLDRFKEMKSVSGRILHLNQDNMEKESHAAREAALTSLTGFGFGMAVAVALASLLAWHTTRVIIRPVQAVKNSALGISVGNLDQVVPVVSDDELGELAEAFNRMARHLREYRQSHSAKLVRAQRTNQATINSFPDPVLVVDAEGVVEMANPAAQRLLGVVPEPHGKVTTAWQPPESLRAPLLDALQGRHNYLPDGLENVITLRLDGRETAYLPRILTIRDPYDHTLGAAVLLQDVTRFRVLDQFKTDLVATVSHELKTPLTSLRLDLHLVLEESIGPLQPKQLELLLDARDNAERLLAIVNNLLDLARLQQQRGVLDLKPTAPAEFLQAALDTVRPRAEDKELELRLEIAPDLPLVPADAPRLQHALNNLLENAIIYTDRGGRVTLSAAAAADDVAIRVADTGTGIPAEHLPHVFDRFFRVPGQSRGSGTGLGLAIAREVVMAHGGTITCESQPGSGTVFQITLPRWVGSPVLESTSVEETAHGQR